MRSLIRKSSLTQVKSLFATSSADVLLVQAQDGGKQVTSLSLTLSISLLISLSLSLSRARALSLALVTPPDGKSHNKHTVVKKVTESFLRPHVPCILLLIHSSQKGDRKASCVGHRFDVCVCVRVYIHSRVCLCIHTYVGGHECVCIHM